MGMCYINVTLKTSTKHSRFKLSLDLHEYPVSHL